MEIFLIHRLTAQYCKVGAAGHRLKHTLPDLPYAYNALAPVIIEDIMELHHKKHHATYVNNLNAAEEKLVAAQAEGMLHESVYALCSVMFQLHV